MRSLKINFWLDAFIFAGFLVALQPRMTGIPIHEWFTLAAMATLILHVLLHWDWVVGITKKFFSNLFHISRLNYLVDGLLFMGIIVVITSGLVISRSVLPTFGLQITASRSWREIHNLSSNLTLLLIALHFALHWSWVKNTFNRLFVKPFQRRVPQAQSLPQPMHTITMKDAKAL
jgi:cytochrome b